MALFTKQIDSDIRDVDSTNSSGSWSATQSSAFNIGNPGAVTRNISLRFIGVTIPQGATISSAKITFNPSSTKSVALVSLIEGVDEDNTTEFVISPEDTARTRTHTTANVAWSGTIGQTVDVALDSPDIVSIIQEIVDRGSWSSGNAMGFWFSDNGSGSGEYLSLDEYSQGSSLSAILSVTYVGSSPSTSVSASPSVSESASISASPSVSVSASPSVSPSASVSASPSVSVSASPSVSISASPSLSPSVSVSLSSSLSISPSPSPRPLDPFFGLKIAKPGFNVLATNTPHELIFSSDFGTLKYFSKQNINTSFDAGTDDISVKGTYAHNLGYYPFTEVFVRVYVGASPAGNYEYCPFASAGATVFYSATYKITTSDIQVFGEINGVSTSVWHFDFLVFIYKNNLNL